MIFDCSSCSLHGLGSGVPAIIASAGNIAAGTVPGVLVGTGVLAAGSLAVPVIGAAIAGVTIAVSMFLNRNAEYFAEEKATTEIVNQAEVLMKQNLAAWNASDKFYSEQQQAIANFNNIWSQVVEACSSSAYSHGSNETGLSPGQRCTSDRQRGGQWDWFSYYLDPIAGDPNVTADPQTNNRDNTGSNISDTLNTFASSITDFNVGSVLPVLVVGGLGVWALSKI